MPTSMVTPEGLLVFRTHAAAGFADGLHFMSSLGDGLWNPMVVVPEGVYDVHCGYCGVQAALSVWGTMSEPNIIECDNHGRWDGSAQLYSVVHRVKAEHWNGIRPLLNERNPWVHHVFEGDALVDLQLHNYTKRWENKSTTEQYIDLLQSQLISAADAMRTFGGDAA